MWADRTQSLSFLREISGICGQIEHLVALISEGD